MAKYVRHILNNLLCHLECLMIAWLDAQNSGVEVECQLLLFFIRQIHRSWLEFIDLVKAKSVLEIADLLKMR